MKLTKQGVRDLNHLKGKSVGKKLTMPPRQSLNCNHKDEGGRSTIVQGDEATFHFDQCRQCGEIFYW